MAPTRAERERERERGRCNWWAYSINSHTLVGLGIGWGDPHIRFKASKVSKPQSQYAPPQKNANNGNAFLLFVLVQLYVHAVPKSWRRCCRAVSEALMMYTFRLEV